MIFKSYNSFCPINFAKAGAIAHDVPVGNVHPAGCETLVLSGAGRFFAAQFYFLLRIENPDHPPHAPPEMCVGDGRNAGSPFSRVC